MVESEKVASCGKENEEKVETFRINRVATERGKPKSPVKNKLVQEAVFLVLYGRMGGVAVTKGMCYKQKMAAREEALEEGESCNGGKDLPFRERYDRRKKRRIDGDDNKTKKTERPSRKPGRGGRKNLLKKRKRWGTWVLGK